MKKFASLLILITLVQLGCSDKYPGNENEIYFITEYKNSTEMEKYYYVDCERINERNGLFVSLLNCIDTADDIKGMTNTFTFMCYSENLPNSDEAQSDPEKALYDGAYINNLICKVSLEDSGRILVIQYENGLVISNFYLKHKWN